MIDMSRIYQEIELEYSKEKVFNLINQIEEYPEFVPGCKGARVLSRDGNIVEAELLISKGGYSESLVTRNTSYSYDCIKIELLRGPLKSLSGGWDLKYVQQNKTKIILDLNMIVKGNFLDIIISNVIEKLMHDMVEAFVTRARLVYG